MVTFGRSPVAQPCDRGSIFRFADLCSARLRWGWHAIERLGGEVSHDDDDNDDDVGDDGDGDNVADDDRAMLDDMDCAAPKMNTSLVAVSGIVGAVGGAKENAERNCASG